MRKEYDFSNGVRGKFYGKVNTQNPIVEEDDDTLDVIFEDELSVLESNLDRIKNLKSRLPELEAPVQEKIAQRITHASVILDEIALTK